MPDPRPVRWLHLSDLHCGCKGRELWEQVEAELHRDLTDQLDKVGGPPDLLLFSGDLAFSGKRELLSFCSGRSRAKPWSR